MSICFFYPTKIQNNPHIFASSLKIALIHRNRNSTLYANPAVGKMIRRVGENHIELEIEGVQKFDAISLQEREVNYYDHSPFHLDF